MAEEGTLGLKRASHAGDDDDVPSKEELQRRMEEARESITQTVSEIKETVTNQYDAVRESISQTLDWREQYRRRPVAFAIGALSVGAIVGYSVSGASRRPAWPLTRRPRPLRPPRARPRRVRLTAAATNRPRRRKSRTSRACS